MSSDFLKDNSELIDKLKQIPALEEFNESDLQELLQMAKLKQFEPGEMILKEGSTDNWIFYLVSGKAKIVKNGITAAADKVSQKLINGKRLQFCRKVELKQTSPYDTCTSQCH